MKAALPLMAELRMIVSELRLFFKEFRVDISGEDTFEKVLYAMRDLPVDQIELVRNRWLEFENKGKRSTEKSFSYSS